MKPFLANKLLLAVTGGVLVAGIGVAVYFGVVNRGSTTVKNNVSSSSSAANSNDDFQRTGQYSFGLAVCDEMTKEQVASVIGKSIVKTQDYSNSGSTGCEYFFGDNSFVIIDVGFSDMANQKQGLEALGRTIKTDSRIKLENMLVYSEKGLIDVYMNIAPGQKYVRVGLSSISVVGEETLIKLASATEAKIRSYR
jgi:hypothetical protein